MKKKTRVLILGGGFGGLYAALEFERRQDPDIEVTLVSDEKLRVALDWALDVFFAKDFVQYLDHKGMAVPLPTATTFASARPIRHRCNTLLSDTPEASLASH